MIDRDHKLPLARQAKAVGISRGSIYYRPRSVGEAGLGLMRRIDELHLEYPFAGSRPTFPIWLNIPLSKSSAFFKPLSICETLAVGMAIITP